MKEYKAVTALDTYNDIVEKLKGDKQKIKEFLDNKITTIREMKDEWGKFVMSSYWNQVRNHSLENN